MKVGEGVWVGVFVGGAIKAMAESHPLRANVRRKDIKIKYRL